MAFIYVAVFLGVLAIVGASVMRGLPDVSNETPPRPPTPDKLSAIDIAQLARTAGFTGKDLTTAVAIALAESHGKVTAYNPETQAHAPVGRGSFGIWQIYLNAHPEFGDWDLYDPAQNAMAAYRVYVASGRKFTAWSTYNSESYLAYASEANKASQELYA